MKKGKILFIDTPHPYLPENLEKIGFTCDSFPGMDSHGFSEIIHDYTGVVIRSKLKLDREILQKATRLKFIARVGAGMENIDQAYAQSRGIMCLNAPEGNRDAVAEQAVGMLLSLFNHVGKADGEVRQGIWKREENKGIELGGKTVGIIGYGNTGSAFARKLKGFDVQLLACDKYKTGFSDGFVKEVPLSEIFERTVVLSLHVPLTHETTHMVDDRFLSKFKNDIYLINTARGKVVNTAHLVQNIERGKVLGACLDVLEYEGFTFENLQTAALPEAFAKLVKMENVILSPHIAGLTHESAYKMARTIFEKIRGLMLDT